MNIGIDSPLAPFIDGDDDRARFDVRPEAHDPLPMVEGLLAGATEVDITAPPGMPKAGYSSNAHTGRGFRTRLRVRILHLRSGTTSMAIVQCDLLGGSAVLQHLVAQALSGHTDVPLHGLFIGATHTHAGPGQFNGSDFYNRFASNQPGFDPAWTQFLVDRVTAGVLEAVRTRAPSAMAVGSTDVWGRTRNRSIEPHVRNPSVGDDRIDQHRRYPSVNPELHLVRVDRRLDGDGDRPDSARHEPLAAMAVFSIHGTGISQDAFDYNADVWAYLNGALADGIEANTGGRAVVGSIEGTHGDVGPAIRPGLPGYVEARRVGRAIGEEAARLHASLSGRLSDDIELAAGFREVDLDRAREIDGVRLPNRPAVGAALAAGANENPTPVVHRLPFFRPGMPKPWGRRRAQGAKWVLLSRWLQPLLMPRRGFPRVLPLQVLRLDTALLVGLPFETTVDAGRRFVEAIDHSIDGAGIDQVIVSSVANEYVGYVTTEEEYALQHYEGGHTLYGPRTQRFLQAHLARLAAETVGEGETVDPVAERRFDLGIKRFLARPTESSDRGHDERAADEIDRTFVGPPTFIEMTVEEDAYWELEWTDVAPGDLRWHEPLVRMESSDDGGTTWFPARSDGRRADDRGWDVGVRQVSGRSTKRHEPHRYAVRWFNPDLRAGRVHRAVLVANADRPERRSNPFD